MQSKGLMMCGDLLHGALDGAGDIDPGSLSSRSYSAALGVEPKFSR
jgi:hypothetical protein